MECCIISMKKKLINKRENKHKCCNCLAICLLINHIICYVIKIGWSHLVCTYWLKIRKITYN